MNRTITRDLLIGATIALVGLFLPFYLGFITVLTSEGLPRLFSWWQPPVLLLLITVFCTFVSAGVAIFLEALSEL